METLFARKWLFVASVVFLYALTLLPTLIRSNFDPSIFIVAGTDYVDRAATPSPIIVRPGVGYDGQFYYRLATAPLNFSPAVNGVTFDSGPWRMQRIGYPLLVWLASLGRPELTPALLVIINLVGIGALALASLRLTNRLQLSRWVVIAILAWPGLPITLSRDTTEIWAAVFLLLAVDAYFANRPWLYALLGIVCVLTRETSILAFGGLGLYSLLRKEWSASVAGAMIGAVFVAWRVFLSSTWGQAFPTSDMSWPLFGLVTALSSILHGTYTGHVGVKWLAIHGYSLVAVSFLVTFSAAVLARMVAAGQHALAFAFTPILLLMALLTTNGGPWTEPIAFFRTFTELFVVGCILLGSAGAPKALTWPSALVLPALWVGAVVLASTSLA